ncbi:hypothetical protein N9315_05140 [Alphaproteobacteria bacterium]|nr:hypothetical protein [Alphaproteobacteria bacterium]
MPNCCFYEYWKLIVDDRVAATNGYCRFYTPAAILPLQLSRKDLSDRDKFELGERAVLPRAGLPIHPITNSLWSYAPAKPPKPDPKLRSIALHLTDFPIGLPPDNNHLKTTKHERDRKKDRYVPLCHQSQSCRYFF